MTQHDDIIRLRHMLRNAREAVAITSGKDFGHLKKDRILELALIRLTEVIGEAAARMSLAGQKQHPSIPWAQVVGMRNRLIHGYDQVDLSVLWDTIQEDLPASHSRTREDSGGALAYGTHRLGRLWSQLLSIKYLTYFAAWKIDQKNEKDLSTLPLFTSMVKHHVPETAKHIIDETITVFGGYGYLLEQDVERRYRDNRIVEMYEGTVEVQLNNMVRLLKKMNLDFIDTNLL